MTKKDYELFAYVINQKAAHHKREVIDAVIDICSTAFMRDNHNFSCHKFDEACRTGLHIRTKVKGL